MLFFSVCWYERTRACYNTLLVLCEREEPGSAPVTQLLIALVLSFELTPLTFCWSVFAIAYLPCGMSFPRLLEPTWIFSFFPIKTALTSSWTRHFKPFHSPIMHVILCETFWCLIWISVTSSFGCSDVRFCAHLKLHLEVSGEMHSFASLATDVEKRIFSPLWAEPFGVSKNSAVRTVGQLFCPRKLK